ncbi:MAG: putative tail fiber assembly-like protein [Pseudomonas orientalis]|nr:putative tail fiber assembly-like protein [Pseudomonas orientalis]
MFASKTTRGFYDPEIHTSMPDDVVEITSEKHAELLAGQSEGKIIAWDSNGLPVLVDPIVALPSCPELCVQIDDAADTARKIVAGDPLRAVEYQRAADEAQAFKDAGYPDDEVPPMVAAWAISGRTAQQAANSILGEAAAYNNALICIRTTRLAAKEQIRGLMLDGKQEEAQALADATVAAIMKAVEGIGNSAGTPSQGELQ